MIPPSADEVQLAIAKEFKKINYRNVIAQVQSGQIVSELGADGLFLRFECDCLDALPYCFAQCCALKGTIVLDTEMENFKYPVYDDPESNAFILERGSDGFCRCLDRETRTCQIYEDRPRTCKEFHCTRGAHQRGWKQSNSVYRQSTF